MEHVTESTKYNTACTEPHQSQTLKHTQNKLSTLSSKTPHINHTGEAQYLSSKAPYMNHTGVSYTCRHAPPSHIYGEYLVITARAVCYHHDYLSGRKPHTLRRHTPNNASTDNTKPRNVRKAKYPQTSIEQPHTTNRASPQRDDASTTDTDPGRVGRVEQGEASRKQHVEQWTSARAIPKTAQNLV